MPRIARIARPGRRRACGAIVALALGAAGVPAGAAAGLQEAVRGALAPGAPLVRGVPEPVRRAVADAWASGGHAPRYVEADPPYRATGLARETVDALADAPLRGLDPQAYAARAWRDALDAPRDEAGAARLEAGLALAFGRHLADAGFGRVDPRELGHDLPSRRRADAMGVAVRAALALPTAAAALERVEPTLSAYRALKSALPAWRTRAAAPTPPELPPLRGKVEPGDAWAGADALRARLVAEGDLPDDATPSAPGRPYDAVTAEALRRFQARHGLEPDGVIGAATLAALRVPATARVRQIELTMERLRWVGPTPPGRWIAVNIPEYRLWAIDGGRVAASMAVVVGRSVTGTPVFVDAVEGVELNPYWNVPRSIASKELYPKLARDPGWLASQHMELLGAAADARGEALRQALARGTARLRQRPGADNALGRVKLAMPNAHDVYLHDTPSRALFARSRRDFSHGCIRLERPLDLAAFVLAGRPEGEPAALRAAIDAGTNRTLRVAPPVPVMIFYATVNAGQDGRLRFVPDVYGHDARLDAALRASGR
jgi:murein L,D-transpeptidase YcbB/YkuD